MNSSHLKTNKSSGSQNLIAFALILVFTMLVQLLRGFESLDEMWIYDRCRAIVDGMVPYRDFPMVQMPLFFYVLSIPVFFSRTFFSFRIGLGLVTALLYFSTYRMLEKKSDFYSALPVALVLTIFNPLTTYNTFLVLFVTCVYRINLKLFENEKRLRLLLIASGIFSACTVLARQTTGTLFMLTEFIFLCVALRKKSSISKVLFFILGLLIPFVPFLIFLLATSSFTGFWDNCLFGLVSFGSGNSAFYMDSIAYLVVVTLGIVSDIFLYRKAKDINILMHIIFGLLIVTVSFPIFDSMHIYMAAFWFAVPLVQLFYAKFNEMISKTTSILIIGIISVAICIFAIKPLPGLSFTDKHSELKLVPLDAGIIDFYDELHAKKAQYESKGYNVVVLTSNRVILSIVEGEVRFPEDLFLVGNFGTKTPADYVNEYIETPNTIIAIPSDYNEENWQNPKDIYEIIKDRCELIEVSGGYEYYIART